MQSNAAGKKRKEPPPPGAVVVDLLDDDDGPIAIDDDDDGDDIIAGFSSGAGTSGAVMPWRRPAQPCTCPVCFCDSEPDEAVSLSACGHQFCEDCITQFVRSAIGEGKVQLTCPSITPSRCGAVLDPTDVKRCLPDAAAAARYERLTLERCIEATEDMGHCPTAGCSFMFVWEEAHRKLECPLCEKSFCLVCRCEPWHAGVRCEQYAAEHGDADAADKVFADMARQQQLKQCPRCKFWVEKSDGCDAMHCRCNLIFCYQCAGVRQAAGTPYEQCTCDGVESLLRAHETMRNHNLE
jgi:hypothetical protein